MTESKLALSEARSRELENQMEAFGDEREKQSRTHLEELRRERDVRQNLNLNFEISSFGFELLESSIPFCFES